MTLSIVVHKQRQMNKLTTIPLLSWAILSTLNAKPSINFSSHLNVAAGSADINEAILGLHAHDPNDEFTLQGLEVGTHITFSDYLSFTGTYNIFLDEEDELDGEFEDIFLSHYLFDKALTLQAGRIYNKTTKENTLHIHNWDFVNASLLTTRFNGEEGLLSDSLQASWKIPIEANAVLSVSYGDAIEEDEEEEEEGLGTDVNGEESNLAEDIFTIALRGSILKDDFNQFHYIAHYTQGTNGFGLDNELYGAGLEYRWRENGLEEGGSNFSIGVEFVSRSVDFSSEDGTVTGNEDETGFAIDSHYGFANRWGLSTRYEHVEGSDIIEDTPELDRVSLAVTKGFNISEQVDGHARLQYDYTDSSEVGESNAVWFQVQLNYGSHH